jgi:dTDP-4-amino-4,6-dideoxygalactose transaminase
MSAARLQEFMLERCDFDVLSGKLIHIQTGRPVTAVVPVHLYGQMADMDAIQELATRYGLIVVEDACQAHGASYYSQRDQQWHKAGSMGAAAAFSFYPGKNLGACGEAGAVATNDEQIAGKIRMLRDHGQSRKYYHDVEGYNGRLDTIQAGILTVKLQHLAGWNQKRRELADNYRQLLAEVAEVALPHEPSWSKAVYHLFVVRVPGREALQAELAAVSIGTGIHYPIPLHLQKAYRRLSYARGDFPVTERVAPEILSLPMFPQLSLAHQERVAHEIARYMAGDARPAAAIPVAAL